MVRLQWGEPPGQPGSITSLVSGSMLPGGLEVAAHGGALLVDDTMDSGANDTFQGNTAGFWPVGANHHPPEVGQLFSQVHRNTVRLNIVAFGPVE